MRSYGSTPAERSLYRYRLSPNMLSAQRTSAPGAEFVSVSIPQVPEQLPRNIWKGNVSPSEGISAASPCTGAIFWTISVKIRKGLTLGSPIITLMRRLLPPRDRKFRTPANDWTLAGKSQEDCQTTWLLIFASTYSDPRVKTF